MTAIAAHGMAVDPPRGWDAEIYRRDPSTAGETPMPVLHLANVALPAGRGDYGSGVVSTMRPGGVFIALLRHRRASAGERLFRRRDGPPWPLAADDLRPETLPHRFAGGAGHQSFFVVAGRPYCLFVAVAGHPMRAGLVHEANRALATITVPTELNRLSAPFRTAPS